MNYTGRPSISGCRPVLSLYPTHRFCQYLLLIFITFTNSSLFNRAFSTNSRRALSHAAGVTAPGCALSGASRQLPQRGSPWQAGSLSTGRLRLDRTQKGGPCLRGQRLLDNAPCQAVAGLDSGALLLPRYCASLVQTKAGRHANGSPSGGAGEEQGDETERARLLTENHRHRDRIALTKSLPIAAPAALSCRACPLRHCFAMPPLPKGEALAGRKAQKTPFRRLQLREGVFFPWDDESVIAFTIFSICYSPQKSSTAQKVYKHSSLWHLLYLFVKVYDIMSLRLVPPNLPRMGEGGCRLMAYIFTFVLSVAANVASYYICKWLDGWLKGRKH